MNCRKTFVRSSITTHATTRRHFVLHPWGEHFPCGKLLLSEHLFGLPGTLIHKMTVVKYSI